MNLLVKTPFRKCPIHVSRSTATLRSKARLLPGKTHYYINPPFQSNHSPSNVSMHTQTYQIFAHSPNMSEATFQLWEFDLLHGNDMHYLVLVQLTHNETALDNLKRNLHKAISRRQVVIHPRIYTQQDVMNIQTSAIDIIKLFEGTNDCVDLLVASGELDVEEAGGKEEEEEEWFEDVFGDAKFPRWERLGGRVVTLFEGREWLVEGSAGEEAS
ncbi:hypothetical protein J3F84DRAFT_401550 [Trichoderma pleuroticola]